MGFATICNQFSTNPITGRRSFDPTIDNPTVGGLKGGLKYEGYGPGRCNCRFASTYPYAIGPRLGVAWQVAPKTILRAGVGISYSRSANERADLGMSAGFGFNTLNIANPGAARPAFLLKDGIPYTTENLFAYNQSPGLRPVTSTTSPTMLDVPHVDSVRRTSAARIAVECHDPA